ncbi:class I SAM-dependent methyltransferase [Rhodobacteraceae bacterium NNCM2]|nr:class I SAM-dependent methyltransferase [Coraliihabitans acroporae]
MDALTSTKGQANLPRWFETFFGIIQRIEKGQLTVSLPDGRRFAVTGAAPGPVGEFNVLNDGFFTRMVRDGELGFAEMYMDGWWETPDLHALMDVLLLNNKAIARPFTGAAVVRAYERLRHWLRSNSKSGSKRNISYHYDLGNDFYATWLDETMSYSSALFTGRGEDMVTGQANKYEAICQRIDPEGALGPGAHILEIGCGWGGFAEHAIRTRGWRITGLTLSREQQAYARELLAKAGLSDQAEILLRDYRDETGVYDGIASIEMLEAVGERYWPVYFRSLRQRLKPGRVAALQVITISDQLFDSYRKGTDFVQKYIFPGGMLPSPAALRHEAARAGLEVGTSTEFGQSYSRTLREWSDTFNARWGEIAPMGFDERFYRMWNFYLACCAACFLARTTDVTQISLRYGG